VLWASATVSQVGSQVTLIAMPFVAIATLHASTFEVALVGVVDYAPLIAFALPAGVWVERLRRRPVMLVADGIRAVSLASVPVVYTLGELTIAQLLAVGLVNGALTVFFDVASQALLPALVAREELPDANAKLQGSIQAGQVVGPGLAGALVAVLAPPYVLLVDAVSFVASCAVLSRVRHREAAPARDPGRRVLAEVREGLAYAARHPILRPNMLFTAAANLCNGLLFSVLLVFAVRVLGLSSGQVGLVFLIANLGSLSGALLAPRLQRRLGLGRVMLGAAFGGWPLLLLPFATGELRIPMLACGLLLWGVAVVVFNVSSVTIVQATTPDALIARTNAIRRLCSWGALPIGALLGGVLGTYLGLQAAVLVGAGGRALAGLIILASPVRHVRTLADADRLVAEAAYRNTSYVGGVDTRSESASF
jgi:MFS family permease